MDISTAYIKDIVRQQQENLQEEKLVNPPPKQVLNRKAIVSFQENEKPKWWVVTPVECYA